MTLGPRLRALADRVLPGLPVADLCCDHAQLAAALVLEGRVPWAIAADINPAPLRGAAGLIDELGLGDRVRLRLGDGASVLEAGEVATVVIAGIGAQLAERIVGDGQATFSSARRLIVQVNHGFPKLGSLRARLAALGWAIVDEAIVAEHERLYPIVVAEPGAAGALDEADRELGPVLRRSGDPLVRAWFEQERERIERALAGMQRGRAEPDTLAHYQRYLGLFGQ
ncbi:MAG TPA: class I SAM-dependent methyltransferase [Enhygromyxa sp.]|nr:class I SAM-dependent methyltransferase [Enhygromyxa sp.]